MKIKFLIIVFLIFSIVLFSGCIDKIQEGIKKQMNQTDNKTSTTTTSTKITTSSSLPQTTTTKGISTTTSTTATSSTTAKETTTLGAQAKCASNYGISSDTVIYIYTKECCDPIVTDRVKTVEKMGYKFKYINAADMSNADESLLKCYINLKDIFVPQFICTGNGNSIVLADPGGMTAKIKNFADECKNP